MPAIVAEGLVKQYGTVRALDGLDLDAAEGTVLALLGPNGAGKTTTVRVLTTMLRPDAGRVEIAGVDALAHPAEVRRAIGVSGQQSAVDDYLTGRENLVLFGELSQLSRRKAAGRADELLEQFDLSAAADRSARTYSGGMRRRLDLAAAIIMRPRVLFLDEPTTGLDPRSRNTLWSLIEDLVHLGTTVLLTTQYLDEADHLANDIVVVDRGTVIARGTADELKRKVGGEQLDVQVEATSDLDAVVRSLRALTGHEPEVDRRDRRVRVPADGARTLTLALRRIDDDGIALSDAALRRPSLDDVFLALTGHHADDVTR